MMAIGRILASSLCILAMCGVALLVGAGSAGAQNTTATVSGVVKDEAGGVMPGATVTVASPDTGFTRSVVTDGQGRYRVPQLSPGKYNIKAELEGFKTQLRAGLTFSVASALVIDFSLGVGDISQEIVVTADAPLVDTNNLNISSLVDEKSLKELPINDRSFIALARLQDGVSSIRNAQSSAASSYGQHLAVSGARPGSNNFMMDGTNVSSYHNLGTGGVGGSMPGMEAVREFRILTHNYGAEYGRGSGAMINIVTKSGTNAFRGSVYEFFRNDALDKKNYFDREKPDFQRNQFGFSLGGRILRDRTFFFANYEGLRQDLGTTRYQNVPTAAAREGRLGTRTVTVNPAVRPLLDMFPLPNGRDFGDGTAEYVSNYVEPTTKDYLTVRLDQNLSQNHRMYVRGTRDYGRVLSANNFADYFLQEDRTPLLYGTVEVNSTLSATVVNALRFGAVKTPTISDNVYGKSTPASLNLVPLRMPQINVTGLAEIGPNDALLHLRDHKSLELSDTVTLQKGSHAVKAGFMFQRVINDPTIQTRMGGRFAFNSLTDLLAGRAATVEFAPPELSSPDRQYRQNLFALFVQDDYKMSEKVTFNLGVRWEMASILKEINGIFPKLLDDRALTTLRQDITVDELGWYKNPTLKNVEPRLGIAYDPFGNGRTSIRGGFGMYHDVLMLTSLAHELARMYPHNVFNVRDLAFPNTAAGVLALVPKPAIGNTAIYFENAPKSSYNVNTSIDVQQQIGSDMMVAIGYRGRRSFNQQGLTNLNQAVPIGTSSDGLPIFSTTPVAPNRDFDTITVKSTNGYGSYHGLALRAEKRFSKGLTFKARYTYSRSIDEGSVRHGGSTDGPGESNRISPDPKYFYLDRGPSAYDVPRNFGITFDYELPIGRDAQGLAGALLKGWSVAGAGEWSSGAAFSVTQATNTLTRLIAGSRRVDLLPGRSADDIVKGGPDEYFDKTAFAFAPPTRWGNSGRNILRGPGYANVDAMLGKAWGIQSLGKDANLQIRIEAYNLFNRSNFANPASASIFTATGAPVASSGRITRTVSGARQMQLGVRLEF